MFVEGGLNPEQIKALRKMSLERRAELGLGFIRSMRRLKLAALRTQHPDWSETQIADSLRQFILHGRS
jgi:hypothetical protein